MKVVFMGTPDFALNILQALIESEYDVVGVVTQPDRFVGRKRVLTMPPIKRLALEYDIPVFQPEKIKNDYKQVIDWQPDIIITCAYGQIIPKILLDFPKYKAINVHASLLPKYRGGAPIHRAIIEGDKKTGITIMYMDEKMDEGDIISQREIPIDKTDNVGTLHDKLSKLGASLLMETLPSIFNNSNKRIKQDDTKATYAYNINPKDEIINWNNNSEEIYNQIRGLNPWPGAYTLLDNKRVKIYEAKEVISNKEGQPGEIVDIKKDGIIVKTGNNTSIKILVVKLEGKRLQSIKEMLNGNHPFSIGKILN